MAQRNQCLSIFRNANKTCNALNVSVTVRLNASLARWARRQMNPLASCAQAVEFVPARLAEKDLAAAGSLKTAAPAGRNVARGSISASGSDSGAGSGGVSKSGGAA